ncbi:hypothetical protein BAU18_000291 [Enterococcus diestrammenae]|uniref:Uncharacterized protein n=1 Tax=Enterococcus diestrammenae TaxID=1155073 RepID=A0ABV0EY53_9ENTE|nr:hypothetical protein BAU18_05080 [Enterococcus diestrammenae]
MERTQIEKIINDKLDVILDDLSLENSLALHLDAYEQILDLIDSNNNKLKSKVKQMIDKSYRSHLETMK